MVDGMQVPYKQQKIWDPVKKKKVINKKLFAFKLEGPGLQYQVTTAKYSSDIVNISGPYLPGEVNDLQMFFLSGLPDMLDENERVDADQGYIGANPEFCVTPDGIGPGRHTESHKKEKKRIDGRAETVNENWSSYACMSKKPFRHDIAQHQVMFYAIGVFTQVAIELGELEIYKAYED